MTPRLKDDQAGTSDPEDRERKPLGAPGSDPPRPSISPSFVRATGAVMFMILAGKVFGFAEKLALAYFEGTSAAVDAYFTAVAVAFFFFVLVDDIVVPVFLSQYVRVSHDQGQAAADRFFQKVFWTTLLVLATCIVALEVSPSVILKVVAPGFEAERLALSVPLIRLALPAGLLLGLAALTYVVLNANRSFAWPAFGGVAYKAGIFLGILLLLPRLGIRGAGISLLIGAALQLLLHLLGIRWWGTNRGGSDRGGTKASRRAPSMVPLMVPLVIGTVAAQISGFVDNAMVSKLTSGSLAALGYARRLVDLPILLVPGVLGIIAFPQFARLAGTGRTGEMMGFLARLIEFCVILFLPLGLLCTFAAPSIVRVVFARGAFGDDAVASTALALSIFSLGMVAYALEILVIRAYYATLDFRTPIGVGLVFVSINIAMTISLTPVLGLVAIPIALSVQKTLKVLVLCLILARRHPGRWLPTLVGRLLRITFCAMAFGLIYWRLQDGGATADPRGFFANVLSVAVAAIPATGVYVVGLQIARVVDFRQTRILWDKILGRQGTG